ncbi:oxygen tolerance protein BatD [Mucilaginibacter gracilis]|uniref:Oxygen tolerance protein BatD n=1 Tax=Mucilaginibacter gracilis TaxID=423350 RepID=A0A495J7H9_9SPHI|nr:BatD family protein [Mucilaginibacter gracilis]RKR84945.1 oxygen tolerance protein BatD [Mucilaginibacter gracilis]
MNIKKYIFILLLCCTGSVWGQSFTASVSKSQVATGEVFEVQFTLNASGGSYTQPSFGGLQVVGGPNESTSMESVNGSMSQSVSIGYDLVASKEGTYTIGSATVVSNGKTLSTRPITVKVIKGSPQQQQQQGGQGQQAGPDNSIGAAASGDMAKNVFIRAVVDKKNVYLGEQITVTYRLYTRVGLVGNSFDKAPDLNGFWSQDIKAAQQNTPWKTEMYQGQRYNAADIKQTILFPQRDGNLIIDPLTMSFVARKAMPARDIMEQMFGGRYEDVKVKASSPPVTIHVKPLPEAGKPAGFTGAVGVFKVAASVDKKELKANEALNYQLKITGSGNIKLLKDANINPPADFEKYDPKITDTITETERGVSGSRLLTYLLIPRHQGNYTIEPVPFSYFNPATGRYVSLATPAFAIKVNKGVDAGGNVTSLSPADQRDIKMLSKDIRYIKTSGPDVYKNGEMFFGSAGYYLLLLLGPLAFAGAFAYRRYNEQQNSDVVKVKNRRAAKLAAKHMANAQHELQAGNTKAFYEAVSRGLYGYLSDKLNIPAADLNQENIAAELKNRSVDDALIQKLLNTLNLCEMARFAPVSGVSQQDVFNGAKSTINDIETHV